MNLTDIYSTWVESAPCSARGRRVRRAPEEIRQALPFPLRGIGFRERLGSPAAVKAVNDLYANEIRLFRNLFCGSRTRRIYGPPQTPFERVCASPAADPERIAELRRQQPKLDPFELSRTIQANLERIFQLSQVTGRKTQTAAQNGECGEKTKPTESKTAKQNQKKRRQRKLRTTTAACSLCRVE